jgi:hypothetical protein
MTRKQTLKRWHTESEEGSVSQHTMHYVKVYGMKPADLEEYIDQLEDEEVIEEEEKPIRAAKKEKPVITHSVTESATIRTTIYLTKEEAKKIKQYALDNSVSVSSIFREYINSL